MVVIMMPVIIPKIIKRMFFW